MHLADKDEWGPWVEHDGQGCPLERGQFVQSLTHGAGIVSGVCSKPPRHKSSWYWENAGKFAVILEYRVRKPNGFRVLEELLRRVEETSEASGDLGILPRLDL